MTSQQMLWTVLLASACLVLTLSAAEEAGKDPASVEAVDSKDYYDPYKHGERKHFYDTLWDGHNCPPIPCHCPPEPPVVEPPPRICLNPSNPPGARGSTVMNARYRMVVSGNWGMAIAPRGNPVSGRFQDLILTNPVTRLNNIVFDFVLTYNPTNRYKWELMGPSGEYAGPYMAEWKDDNDCFPTGNPTATCPSASFQAIELRVTASSVSGNTMTIRDLVFEAELEDVAVCGKLPASGLSATFGNSPITSWIVSDTDLSQIAWKVRGKVVGIKLERGDEAVKFDISTVAKPSSGDFDVACESSDQNCQLPQAVNGGRSGSRNVRG